MNIVEKVLVEKSVPLKVLGIGDIIRFSDISYSEAIQNDDGPVFYWVREKQEGKLSGLVKIESLDFKVTRLVPEETPVIRHECEMKIAPAELV